MRRYGRRKQRLSWFIPLGTTITPGEQGDPFNLSGLRFEMPVNADGTDVVQEFPLTFDVSQDQQLAAAAADPTVILSLSDLQNESWRIRRLVGKLHASFLTEDGQATALSAPPAVIFGAGLMVNKVGENGLPPATDSLSPLRQSANTDPWIWRRVWMLGQNYQGNRTIYAGNIVVDEPRNAGTGQVDEVAASRFPATTDHFGSIQDGPHVDAKTNRIIGPDERLFLWLATCAYPGTETYESGAGVFGYFDYRMLGALMRSTNRRNASR